MSIECIKIVNSKMIEKRLKATNRKKGIRCDYSNDTNDDMRKNIISNHKTIRNRFLGNSSTLIDTIVLTDVLLEQLQGYVDYYWINNLLNTSQKYKSAKLSAFYWKLNKKYSLRYYKEILFKKKFHMLLIDVNKQLSLDLHNTEIIDVSSLQRVHSLNLQCCRNIVDVSALGTVKSLNLSFCDKIMDLSALHGCQTIILSARQKAMWWNMKALINVHILVTV
jgi:hypothetical protein